MAAAKRRGGRRGRRSSGDRLKCLICGKWLRAITGSHLRKHNISPAGYKRRFGVDYLYSDEVREKQSRAARFVRGECPDDYVPRSKAEIVQALRDYARPKSPLTLDWLSKQAPSLARQAGNAFGGWVSALNAAKLPRKRIVRWSKERVLDAIRKLAAKGCSLRAASVGKRDPKLLSAAVRYCGGWREALEASGVDCDPIPEQKVRTREALTRDLRSWVKEHGPLNPKRLHLTDSALYWATTGKFGRLSDAARELGLPYRSTVQPWSEERVLDGIRRRASSGCSLAAGVVKQDDSRLYAASGRLFGSWANAAEAAGFEYPRCQRWTMERIVAEIRLRASEGRPLKRAVVSRENRPLVGAARHHFGSWGAAVSASGFDYANIRRIRTPQNISRDLRAWVREHGSLNATALEASDSGLHQAACRLFGSTAEAVRVLGLPYYSRLRR
ncbi:MAG: hypothetical protein ACYS9X_27615 [Planctomycetota bacterium]|jgi:hypothetical protein